MKKVLILGTGAQGSTVAQRLDEEPNVAEIICADYDMVAVENLVKILKKATGKQVNAYDQQSIIDVAQGVDLIVNALPLNFGKNVLEAALAVKANYQDFAAMEDIHEDWVEGVKIMLNEYGPRFAANNTLAVLGTGSAPGLICVASRVAVRDLDSCETIYNFVWEGVEAKRFLPFWWSPVTALGDMRGEMGKGYGAAYAFENGEIITTQNFSRPVYRKYDYMDKEVKFVEHLHDEPVQMGLHAEECFKGAKNIYFKYAGAGVGFAEPLFRAGMLSTDPVEVNGHEVIPFDFVLKHIPAAPKFKEDIKEIIDEGLVTDAGCMVVEAYGKKDGKDVKVEVHVFSPGLVESFEKAGITGEMYLTGQAGYLFSKLFIDGKYTQTGLITSDQLTYPEVDYYFAEAEKLDITLDIRTEEQ